MVKMNIKFSWYIVKPEKKEKQDRINMSKFSYHEKQETYKAKLEETSIDKTKSLQEKWNEIARNCISVSTEVMRTKTGKKKQWSTEAAIKRCSYYSAAVLFCCVSLASRSKLLAGQSDVWVMY